MSPDEIVSKVRDGAVSAIWRQWRSLGAMTNTGAAQTIVDPEALVLASLSLQELEPRFQGVLESWIWQNSRLMNVQRVRTLAAYFPESEGRLPGVAALAAESGDDRWKPLGRDAPDTQTTKPKGRSTQVQVTYSGALMLQLRAGFGVGVRADVLSYLLGVSSGSGGWVTATNMARALSYTPTAIRQVADEMGRADFVEPITKASEGRGRGARMYRVRQSAWQTLAPMSTQRWAYWSESLQFASGLHFWARNLGDAALGLSEFAIRTFIGEFLATHREALWRPGEVLGTMPTDTDEWWAHIGSHVGSWRDWVVNNS